MYVCGCGLYVCMYVAVDCTFVTICTYVAVDCTFVALQYVTIDMGYCCPNGSDTWATINTCFGSDKHSFDGIHCISLNLASS